MTGDVMLACDNCDAEHPEDDMVGGHDVYTAGYAPQAVPLLCPACAAPPPWGRR